MIEQYVNHTSNPTSILEIYCINSATISNNQSFGSYNLSNEQFKYIKKELDKEFKNSITYEETSYKIRNMIIKKISSFSTYRIQQYNSIIHQHSLCVLLSKQSVNIENDDIPILSKYDETLQGFIQEFTTDYGKIYCVTCVKSNLYYIYASVNLHTSYNNKLSEFIDHILTIFN